MCTHRIRHLDNFYRKWSPFVALVNSVPWRKLLGEEFWQGLRARLGKLTCNQRSNSNRLMTNYSTNQV